MYNIVLLIADVYSFIIFLYYEDESIEFYGKNIALISIFVMDKTYFIINTMYVLLLAIFQFFSYIVVICVICGETGVL